jgi:hypothetical protein
MFFNTFYGVFSIALANRFPKPNGLREISTGLENQLPYFIKITICFHQLAFGLQEE